MAEGTRIWLFTMLVVLQVVTLSAQNPCESPVFTNGMVFEALMENSPENTTIVANMSFAGTAVGFGRTIELTLQDSSDKEWGLLIEELQQLRLRLEGKVLDRDGDTGIRDLRFVIRCKTIATDPISMVDNSIIVTVLDLNDNAPAFIGAPYNQEVIELTPVGSTIFRRVTAEDPDSNENGRVNYQIQGQSDYFEIPLPPTGDIVLKKSLDYEGFQPGEEKKYLIPIIAHDLAANKSLRKSSTTTVTIIVTDGDDQAVQFLPCIPQGDICDSPLYESSVMENTEPLNQPLTFDPAPVFAIDLDIDVQGPPGIVYSFLAGSPSDFRDYFDIDGPTGNISLKRPVERTQVEEFIITIKAEQDDNPLQYATADVKIGVGDDDVNKPYFFISTGEAEFKGYVREFTGQAVIVFKYDESPLLLEVRDDDFTDKVVPKGAIRYELTDTSGRFDITDTGYLLVDANQLDIDIQREYRMTVRAIETTTFQKLSTDDATVVVTVLNESHPHQEGQVEDNDINKPYFFISTGESQFKGYVREFTGQAVVVLRYDGSPLLLEVRDDDFTDKVVPKGAIRYELTDTSRRFDITDTGYLLVDANQLDMETRREYRMTVRAIETTTFQKLSTDEVTVVVTVLNAEGPYQGGSTGHVSIAAMASVGVVAALLLIGLVAAVTYIVVSKRKDGTPRPSKTAEHRRNPGTRSVPTFDNQAFDEVGNGNITNQRQTISADTDSEYAVPVVERNGHMEEGAYQPLDPNTRINSDYQKLERGTITQDSSFDDTYYTDTRTNRLSDDGTYLEVM